MNSQQLRRFLVTNVYNELLPYSRDKLLKQKLQQTADAADWDALLEEWQSHYMDERLLALMSNRYWYQEVLCWFWGHFVGELPATMPKLSIHSNPPKEATPQWTPPTSYLASSMY